LVGKTELSEPFLVLGRRLALSIFYQLTLSIPFFLEFSQLLNSEQYFLPVVSFAISWVNARLVARKGKIWKQKESIMKLKRASLMKKVISALHTINALSNKVWVNISKATGVSEWMPFIKAY
jgi:hypothetical protein